MREETFDKAIEHVKVFASIESELINGKKMISLETLDDTLKELKILLKED